MRLPRTDLQNKALLSLEDALQELRFRTPRRSHSIRFALAYLYATSDLPRDAIDTFWRELHREHGPNVMTGAEAALNRIYHLLGVTREHAVVQEMWRAWVQHEGTRGKQ